MLYQCIGVSDGIWTHAIRSHNPLLYLILYSYYYIQCWWKDSNFQLLPYESSLLPLKYINYYSSWPMLGWWELNSPVTNYSFNCLSDRGDTSQCAEKVGIEPTSTGFGDQCSTNWATPQLLLLIALRELSEMMASSIASYLTKLLAKVFAGKIGLEPILFWLTVSSLYHISSIPIMLLL